MLRLFLVEQGYGDHTQAIQATPSLLGVVPLLILLGTIRAIGVHHRSKDSDACVNCVKLILFHEALYVFLELSGCLLSFFDRSRAKMIREGELTCLVDSCMLHH